MGHSRAIKRGIALTMFLAITVPMTSCVNRNTGRQGEAKDVPRYVDTVIGKVNSIESASGIVMIRTFGKVKSQDSDVIFTKGPDGTTGTVTLSGQSNKFFVAAEYVSGNVIAGDAVYRRRLTSPEKSENAPIGSDNIGPQDNVLPANQHPGLIQENPFKKILP